jgi:hypothetical protein
MSNTGTDLYTSKEQRNGLRDYKNDIFSLGVIILFLVTGDATLKGNDIGHTNLTFNETKSLVD